MAKRKTGAMLKRYSLLLATFIFFILTVNGCEKKTTPELGRYYSKDKGFSIRLPDIWEIKENYLRTTIAAFSPKDNPNDEFYENVNVLVEDLPSALSTQEYYQMNLAKMHKYVTNFQEIEHGQTTINGEPAEWLIYSHKMGPSEVKAIVYILVKEKLGYSITGAAAPELFDKYRHTFEMTAKSFKFE